MKLPTGRGLLILILLISIDCIGCVSTRNFEQIPVAPTDFQRPYSELTQAFPEIKIYEDRFRFPKNNTPLATDLIATWGEPNAIKTNLWYYSPGIAAAVIMGPILDLSVGSIVAVVGGTTALLPGPEKTYTWIKGDYCIDAVTGVGVASLYRRAILSWKWLNIHETEKLSKDCEAIISTQNRDNTKQQQTKTE